MIFILFKTVRSNCVITILTHSKSIIYSKVYRSCSSNVFYELLKDYVPPSYQDKKNAYVSFPEMCSVIHNYKNNPDNNNLYKLSNKDILNFNNKIELFSKKALLLEYLQSVCNETSWYKKNDFYTKEKNNLFKLTLDISPQKLKDYFSWSIKQYHNMVFIQLHKTLTTIETRLNIPSAYSLENTFNETDIKLLTNYIKSNKSDQINGKKAMYINVRYLINYILYNQEFNKILKEYDVKYNKNFIKQSSRYIREFLLYLRLIYIFEQLIQMGRIKDQADIKKILEVKNSILEPTKKFIPINNILNFSNKVHDKCLELLHDGDNTFFTLLNPLLQDNTFFEYLKINT